MNVPGLDSLAVTGLSPRLVDHDRYAPEQVLVAQLSDGVRSDEIGTRAHAWVLPRHKPRVQQDDDAAYDWQPSEIGDAVLKQSTPLPLAVVPTEDDYAPMQRFKFHATPGRKLHVRVDAGLKSGGGYLLGEPAQRIVTVPDYPKLLRFMADGSLLSLSGSKRLSIVARNLPGMKLEISRVLPDQLQHLVSFNQGSDSQPALAYRFSEDPISASIRRTASAACPCCICRAAIRPRTRRRSRTCSCSRSTPASRLRAQRSRCSP